MTKKRFIVNDESIIDTVLDELFNASSEQSADYIAYRLNELSDKIGQLKKENEQLKQAYDDAKSDVEKYEQILKDIFNDNLLIQDAKKELSE